MVYGRDEGEEKKRKTQRGSMGTGSINGEERAAGPTVLLSCSVSARMRSRKGKITR